jgi:hypothetical protein
MLSPERLETKHINLLANCEFSRSRDAFALVLRSQKRDPIWLVLFGSSGTFRQRSEWVERTPVSPHPNCKKHFKQVPRLTQNTTCPHEYLRRRLTRPNEVSQGTFMELGPRMPKQKLFVPFWNTNLFGIHCKLEILCDPMAKRLASTPQYQPGTME